MKTGDEFIRLGAAPAAAKLAERAAGEKILRFSYGALDKSYLLLLLFFSLFFGAQ